MSRLPVFTQSILFAGWLFLVIGCSKQSDGWADEPSADLYFNQVSQQEKATTDAVDAKEEKVESACTVSASSEAYGAFVARANDTESMLEQAQYKFRAELKGSQVLKKGDTVVLGSATQDEGHFMDSGAEFELSQVINQQTSLEHPDLGEITFQVGDCTIQEAYFGAIHITAAMLRVHRK